MDSIKGLLQEVRRGQIEEDNKQIDEIRNLVLKRSEYGYRFTEYRRDIRPTVMTFLVNENFKVSTTADGLPRISWEENKAAAGSLYNLAMHNIKIHERGVIIRHIRTEIICNGKSSVEFKHIDRDLQKELINEGFVYLPTPDGGSIFKIPVAK